VLPALLYAAGKIPGVKPMHRRATLLHALGRIPGVTPAQRRGHQRLREHLDAERGDADVLGIIKTDGGWEFVPLDMVGEGDDLWAVPRDSDEPAYPADGCPEEPQTLLGTPVILGYKNYGAASELPQFDEGEETDDTDAALVRAQARATDSAATSVEDVLDADLADQLDSDTNGDRDGDTADDSNTADDTPTATERLRGAVSWVAGWPGRRYRGLRAWLQRRYENHKRQRYKNGWYWKQAGYSTLIMQQDGDAKWNIEPADYHKPDSTEAIWNGYKTDSGSRFDARGHGGEPTPVYGRVSLGMAFGPMTKLLAPATCRLARNLHNARLRKRRLPETVEPASTGAVDAAQNGEHAPATDGGGIVRDAIALPERALVAPRDVQLADNETPTQEYTQRTVEQSRALANPPGSGLAETALKTGIVLVALIIGALVGDPGMLWQIWHGLTGLAIGVSVR